MNIIFTLSLRTCVTFAAAAISIGNMAVTEAAEKTTPPHLATEGDLRPAMAALRKKNGEHLAHDEPGVFRLYAEVKDGRVIAWHVRDVNDGSLPAPKKKKVGNRCGICIPTGDGKTFCYEVECSDLPPPRPGGDGDSTASKVRARATAPPTGGAEFDVRAPMAANKVRNGDVLLHTTTDAKFYAQFRGGKIEAFFGIDENGKKVMAEISSKAGVCKACIRNGNGTLYCYVIPCDNLPKPKPAPPKS